MKFKQILYMFGFATVALIGALFANPVQATYVYEADQDLYDLQTNGSGATGLGSNDDSVSSAFNLGFTFTFYGNDFTQARMATNGCLHFNLTGSYCGDYTPDPLPQYTNTLFVFWTDLIKDNGSAMKAKAFDDYTIFGWYNMREYNRANSDNSIEVWLYPNNTFEYRYGELDIKTHDVLIGEQGPTTSDIYTYLFFDECNTGTTNISGTCVSYDWNSSSNAANTLLEDGGSLYGLGTGNVLDCSSPLNNAACTGYAAAYLAQQCGISDLYSETCSGYANAYDDQQCGLDSQYAPFCAGYTTTASVAYYDETDYGYENDYYDDQYGYDTYENDYYEDDYYEEDYEDQYADNCIDNPDWCYEDDPYWDVEFTDEEWYAIDIEEFGQEQADEWYGTDVVFSDEGYIEWDSSELNTWDELDVQMDQYDEIYAYEDYEEEIFVEDIFYDEYERTSDPIFYEDDYFETDYTYAEHDLVEIFNANEILEEFEFLTITSDEFMNYEEEVAWEEFETIEELEEWYEEEIEEEYEEEYLAGGGSSEEQLEEELYAEELFEEETVEEIYEEIVLAEAEETIEEIELELVINEEPSNSGVRSEQLNVVANSVRAATNSISGTTSGVGSVSITYGTSSQSTGNTVASGGTSSVATGAASVVGVSTTSSPSISDQFASASAQTQQVLALSPSTAVSSDLSSAGTDFSTSVVSTSTNSSIEAAETIASTDATASVSIGETVASTSSDTSTVETVASTSSDTSSSSTEVTITPMPGMGGQPQVAMVDVQVAGLSSEIDTASTGVMTASEADQIADKIIANNIEEQQQQVAASAEETGEYGDQTALVAYIGFNPNFSDYYSHVLPQKTDWYEPREIYANAKISDNISAFYDMAGTSLRTIRGMINSQPNLLGE